MNCLHGRDGKLSMMRVGYFITLALGSIMCLSGVAAAFLQLPDANNLILGGTTMISTTGFAKAVQTKWENTQ